jgi:hypothetical protein
MPDYKPDPTIPQFIYKVSTDTVYLDCIVKVPIPAYKGLNRPAPSYDVATKTASKSYSIIDDNSQLNPYEFKDLFRVPVLHPSPVIYTPNDKPGFIAKLRPYLAPAYYLYASTPVSSGQNSIANTNTIVIE